MKQIQTGNKWKWDAALCCPNPDSNSAPRINVSPVVTDPDNSVELKKTVGLCPCTVTTGIKGNGGKRGLR